ncbi:MAG TPA: Fe-Mn family superoxide dismutase [Steroidobacteraceae bacterium]|nr:Fe-Mn family superoxide dismutase [Steroidobacteraceae bacterium]
MATVQQHRAGAPETPPESTPVRQYVARSFEPPLFGKLGNASVTAHLGLYKGYIDQTNTVLESITQRDRLESAHADHLAAPESLARRLSFELNGVVLHELFFEQYLPVTHEGSGAFERAACHNFGSVERWKSGVRALSKARGPGWVVTVHDEQRDYLHNVWIALHELYVPAGHRIVFALDLWEHAYMPDYGVKGRDDYSEAALQAASLPCLDARMDRATR